MKEIIIYLLIIINLPIISQAYNTLELAITDYPPYEFMDNSHPQGISVEIVKEVFRRMEQPIKIKVLPWSRSLQFLKTGEIDIVIEVIKTKDRMEFMDFSTEILMIETTSLFVLESSNITFEGDLSKLKNYTFGIRKDFSYGKIFDNALKNNVITNYVIQIYDNNRLLDLLATKKIDIYVGDNYSTLYQYQISGIVEKIKKLTPDVESTPTYVAFSKKRELTKIREQFDFTLAELKSDGTYNKIIEEWILKNSEN